MVTLENVAAHAGVSRATVSRVVNGDSNVKLATRQRIEQAIIDLGYSPNPAARALASSQSQTLGLVTTSYLGGFFGMLMNNVQTEADKSHKQLLVTQGGGTAANELNAINKLYNMRCDGLILHVRCITDQQLIDLSKTYAFILLDRNIVGLESRCISFDHHLASILVAQFLIEHGHRHIACISGPQTRASSRLRYQGFIDTIIAAKLTPIACISGQYDLPSGYEACNQLLQQSLRPSAIYCCNEEMALGALLAISEYGLRIPDDISLICYDSGERAAFVSPKLTSIHFPIAEMATRATRLLIDQTSVYEDLKPIIIDRGSVKCLSLLTQ
ncbi:LacI family DNA-binding transcriptional regulator [Photobacterium toruni]|uniref:HTH-type transcriptional regulator GalS n=1 Tax=Photobacterium toruni TaxID=1935446 RepID=A0A1T4SX88_9GAMM|nr:LacI family DNA-binding transcriptional regulator [Photobacterium toruni]SKA32769.1 HTH-type transcriptional regulator GalS [Photobacterium toruni]